MIVLAVRGQGKNLDIDNISIVTRVKYNSKARENWKKGMKQKKWDRQNKENAIHKKKS